MNTALHWLPLGFILERLLSFFLNVRGWEVLYLSFFMRWSIAKLWGQCSEICPLSWTSHPPPHKNTNTDLNLESPVFSVHPLCLCDHIIRSQNLKEALPLNTNSTANHILSQTTMFASNLADRICWGILHEGVYCIQLLFKVTDLTLWQGQQSYSRTQTATSQADQMGPFCLDFESLACFNQVQRCALWIYKDNTTVNFLIMDHFLQPLITIKVTCTFWTTDQGSPNRIRVIQLGPLSIAATEQANWLNGFSSIRYHYAG